MILDRELTTSERRFSQLSLRNYWILSALALACCGDAVLPLLGIKLGLPDAVLSTLGAMNYASFLLLPLGFLLGARWGAGKSMAIENAFMALAVLLIASSVILGKWMFFIGLTLFLTARAANYAMRFTLQKHIALESEMPAMLARNYIGMHSAGLFGCLTVAAIFKVFLNDSVIPLVLLAGAILFSAVAVCIGRIKEPLQVKLLAAQPLAEQVRNAWSNPLLRHQIYVGMLLNGFLAAVVPVNIITAKKGVGISDSMTVLLTAVQAVSAIAGSVMVREITKRCGPRKMMLWGYPLAWLLCVSWCVLPMQSCSCLLIIPFILGGAVLMVFGTSLENYFLITIPDRQQLGGTFMVFVATGGIAGVLGMFLNFIIFKLAGTFLSVSSSPMSIFSFYFMIAGIIFAAGIIAPYSLPDNVQKNSSKN